MRIFGLALVLAITVISGIAVWFGNLSEESSTKEVQYKPDDIDYRINNFKAVIFDKDGNPSQQLKGDKLVHFPFDNHHEITSPKGQTLQGVDTWKVDSQTAKTAQGLSELHWQGNVHIQQSGDNPVSMRTDKLLQKPREHTAQTNEGIVVDSPMGTINAETMLLNTMNSKLDLKGQVNSVYQVQ